MESVSVIKKVPKEIFPEVPQSNTSLFKRNPELFKHIIIICDNPIKYKCTVCNKSFKSKANCSYHKNCPNDSMKQHECEICKRRFSVKSHYKYHLLTHNGSNPFSCSVCGKSFKAKNKLRRHEEVHAEKRKSYPCHKCEKTFLGKTSLKNHLRSHNGEKLFHCSHCSKAFSEKKNLIHHLNSIKKIKNWVCEVCGSSFVVKWNLELHRRTHTATRSFKCPDCPTKFLQKRYLIRHMELHKKDCKYECQTCNLEFSRKDNLRRHNMRHLEESGNKESKQSERSENNHLVAAKSVEGEKLKESSSHEDNTRRKSEEVSLSKKANTLKHHNIAAAFDLCRESVIKSVSKSTICNRISVIKDGREEFAKVCPSEVGVRIQNAAQLVPCQSYPSRNSSVVESISVQKPRSSDQSQRIQSQLSCHVQNTNCERMQMTRHCPIPKKKMVASYMNELYADSVAANSNATDESRSSTLNFVQSNSSRCFRYCDNNLLDLSMKSQSGSCY